MQNVAFRDFYEPDRILYEPDRYLHEPDIFYTVNINWEGHKWKKNDGDWCPFIYVLLVIDPLRNKSISSNVAEMHVLQYYL